MADSCHTASQVLEMFEAARKASGPVRDHRPLCLNLDDHIRVSSVKKAKGSNFRSLPGVVTNSDGEQKGTISFLNVFTDRISTLSVSSEADSVLP